MSQADKFLTQWTVVLQVLYLFILIIALIVLKFSSLALFAGIGIFLFASFVVWRSWDLYFVMCVISIVVDPLCMCLIGLIGFIWIGFREKKYHDGGVDNEMVRMQT